MKTEDLIENWKEKVIDTNMLISLCGESIISKKIKGETLLHIAIKLNDKHLFKELLSNEKIRFDVKNKEEITPLRYAIMKKRKKFILDIFNHKNYNITYDQKSDITHFCFDKVIKNYRVTTPTIIQEYRIKNSLGEKYQPSLLTLLLLYHSPEYYVLFKSKLPQEEEFSEELTISIPEIADLDHSLKTTTIFEIALLKNAKEVVSEFINNNIFYVQKIIKKYTENNKITPSNQKKGKILFYTSIAQDYNFYSKPELKHYPIKVLINCLQDNESIKNEHSTQENLNSLLQEIPGSYFKIDEDFCLRLFNILEKINVYKKFKKTETISKEIIKRRI